MSERHQVDWSFSALETQDTEAVFPVRAASRFGPYTVVSKLGQGSMGAVFRAHDPAGRDVALKLLPRNAGELAIARFAREGQVTAALEHSGIVRVFGAGRVNGHPFLVYELVEGDTLAAVLPSLPREARLDAMELVARAVGHAHAHGVVHRDLKAENVLFGADGRPRVADFGLAFGAELERLTLSGALVGTPYTMSPEQLSGTRDQYGAATDVWALGVMLYEALTGVVPFPGPSLPELLAQVASGKLPSMRSPDASVPQALERVCQTALSLDPGERYADGAAFADALRAARDAPASSSLRPLPFALGAGALVAVLVALGFVLTPQAVPPPAPSPPDSPTPIEQPEPRSRVTERPAGLPRWKLEHVERGSASWIRLIDADTFMAGTFTEPLWAWGPGPRPAPTGQRGSVHPPTLGVDARGRPVAAYAVPKGVEVWSTSQVRPRTLSLPDEVGGVVWRARVALTPGTAWVGTQHGHLVRLPLSEDPPASARISTTHAINAVVAGHGSVFTGLGRGEAGKFLVQQWSASTLEEVGAAHTSHSMIWSLAIRPDGEQLAVGNDTGRVYLLALPLGSRPPRALDAVDFASSPQADYFLQDPTPIAHRGSVFGLAYAAAGARIYTLANPSSRHKRQSLRVWNTETGELLRTTPLKGRAHDFDVSDDERTLVFAKGKTVEVWTAP